MRRESNFQSSLIKELKNMFPGCIILKNDANYLQGVPDIILLYNDKWAVLEFKQSAQSTYQPNQEYYINIMNEMSYASVVYPEIKEEVLYELQQALRPDRSTRVSKRK